MLPNQHSECLCTTSAMTAHLVQESNTVSLMVAQLSGQECFNNNLACTSLLAGVLEDKGPFAWLPYRFWQCSPCFCSA